MNSTLLSKTVILSALILLLSKESFASNCYQQCEKLTKIKLCFVTHETYTDTNNLIPVKTYLEGMCEDARMVVTSAPSGIRNSLTLAIQKCEIVEDMIFAGHGSVGWHEALHTNYTQIHKEYKDLSCAMAPNARIALKGCNTGRGCQGQTLMYNMAKTFLDHNGGTIISHTNYAVAAPFIDSTSINGTDKILKWSGGDKPEGQFSLDGLEGVGFMETEACLSSMSEKVDEFYQVREETPLYCKSEEKDYQNIVWQGMKIAKWNTQNHATLEEADKEFSMVHIGWVYDRLERLIKEMQNCVKRKATERQVEESTRHPYRDFLGI
jgi:hypothetical protein